MKKMETIINGIYCYLLVNKNKSTDDVVISILEEKEKKGAKYVAFFTDNEMNLFIFCKNKKINPYETRSIRAMGLSKELQIGVQKAIKTKQFGIISSSINKIAILPYSL